MNKAELIKKIIEVVGDSNCPYNAHVYFDKILQQYVDEQSREDIMQEPQTMD